MPFTLLAGIVVILHLGFIAFVLFGGLCLSRWSWVIWLHAPAVVYAILVQTIDWRCPLTALEKWLRSLGGQEPYGAEFLPHYIWSPLGLAESDVAIAVGLIAAIVLVNARPYLAWATG